MKTLVIAEPGCTHQGDKDAMLALIHVAADAGADVFKNQWTSAPDVMVAKRRAAGHHIPDDPYLRYYSWLAYPLSWHQGFAELCAELGMRYACSTYLERDIAAVATFVSALKISSYEAKDLDFVKAHRRFVVEKRSLWISTGLVSKVDDYEDDVRHALNYKPSVLFHCVSAYPAPLEEMQIGELRPQIDEWSREVDESPCKGFSDHSRHLLAGALSVACGATLIETHFRLDSCDPDNPDYPVAFSPAEFAQYIKNIRDAETLVGA